MEEVQMENAAPNEDEDLANEDDVSGGEEGEDGEQKQEYVKKEFVARPFDPTPEILEAVENSIIKDKRPLIRMRVSRPRKDFGGDAGFIERDA